MIFSVVLLLVVVDVGVVAVEIVEGSQRPFLGGTRSTTRMKIVVIVDDTTKDISKLVSILFFYFIMFLPV